MVPTLDEEAYLRQHLSSAIAAADEVVVSDGGSSDGTREVAASLGARVVAGPAGRGAQLNRGAATTDAEILLFLHADTALPPEPPMPCAPPSRRAVAAAASAFASSP